MTEKEIFRAYSLWLEKQSTEFKDLEKNVEPFLTEAIPSQKQKSWIKSVRETLGFSMSDIATKLNISRQAIAQFEKSESEDKITLQNLRKVAEAMDCELVYAIRPKKKIPFSMVIWKKFLNEALRHPTLLKANPHRKAQALAAQVQVLTKN